MTCPECDKRVSVNLNGLLVLHTVAPRRICMGSGTSR